MWLSARDTAATTFGGMVNLCEEDEKRRSRGEREAQRRQVTFVTETGLSNIFAQSRKNIARAWRRVVHEELISLCARASKGQNIAEQFGGVGLYGQFCYHFDEETGQLMRFPVT